MTPDSERNSDVRVTLTPDEALVLFEFLSRFDETDVLAIKDHAEEKALWKLLGKLEEILVPPLRPDYKQLLEAARTRLRDP